jgi:hypothetical protein
MDLLSINMKEGVGSYRVRVARRGGRTELAAGGNRGGELERAGDGGREEKEDRTGLGWCTAVGYKVRIDPASLQLSLLLLSMNDFLPPI